MCYPDCRLSQSLHLSHEAAVVMTYGIQAVYSYQYYIFDHPAQHIRTEDIHSTQAETKGSKPNGHNH